MAYVAELKSRVHDNGGNLREVYWLYTDGAAGTINLDTTQDGRGIYCRAFDSSTAGTIPTVAVNINTNVITFGAFTASTALTAVSGGVAGGTTFTGTGGVIGRYLSGDANFQANTTITNVSGATITVDKYLLGVIAAGNMTSRAVVEVEYTK